MTRYAIKQPSMRHRHDSPGITQAAELPKEPEPLVEVPPTDSKTKGHQD